MECDNIKVATPGTSIPGRCGAMSQGEQALWREDHQEMTLESSQRWGGTQAQHSHGTHPPRGYIPHVGKADTLICVGTMEGKLTEKGTEE